jgi:hypothetical protein
MSEQKRSAADEADRKARNPTAARQKISQGQTAPEFHQNRVRLKAERLAREAELKTKKMRAARLKELEEMAADQHRAVAVALATHYCCLKDCHRLTQCCDELGVSVPKRL